jgi:hypothetical protein
MRHLKLSAFLSHFYTAESGIEYAQLFTLLTKGLTAMDRA